MSKSLRRHEGEPGRCSEFPAAMRRVGPPKLLTQGNRSEDGDSSERESHTRSTQGIFF